jgi:chromosome segregation ATPase
LQTAFDELEQQKCSSDSLNSDLERQMNEHLENIRISSERMAAAEIRLTNLSEELKERDDRIAKLVEEVSWFKMIMAAGVNRELPN